MASLPDLDRRLSRRIEQGKGILLSADDLDLIVSSGAYDKVREATAEYQRTICLHRSAKSRSISGGNSHSTGEQGERTSKSSGMTQSESASEALARARRTLRKVN